jgi:hypothetical protein
VRQLDAKSFDPELVSIDRLTAALAEL